MSVPCRPLLFEGEALTGLREGGYKVCRTVWSE